jgi:hypothetical protein
MEFHCSYWQKQQGLRGEMNMKDMILDFNYKSIDAVNNQWNKHFMEDYDDRFKELWFYRQI